MSESLHYTDLFTNVLQRTSEVFIKQVNLNWNKWCKGELCSLSTGLVKGIGYNEFSEWRLLTIKEKMFSACECMVKNWKSCMNTFTTCRILNYNFYTLLMLNYKKKTKKWSKFLWFSVFVKTMSSSWFRIKFS